MEFIQLYSYNNFIVAATESTFMEPVMTNQQNISEFIHKLLNEHGYVDEVASSDSLILSGMLDSLAVIHIVVFLEQQFGIDFSEVYFDQTSFDSIDQITNFIQANKPS
jgi:acyl carrier protein